MYRLKGVRLLLLTVLSLLSRACHSYVITNGSICFDYRSAENISTIIVLCGLRASRGSYQTCARHQTIKALVPGIDERVSAVELAFPRNETALYDEAILEGVANVSDWGGGLVQPDNKTIENTAVIGRQEAVLFTRLALDIDNQDIENLNAALEYAPPRDVNQIMPADLLIPPPGKPNGQTPSPLLLYYRRDWWAYVTNTTLGPLKDTDPALTSLPPTWELFADVVTQLLNTDFNGDGQPDHVLCIDLQPGCKAWAVLAALYGAVAQPGGTRQGAWFARADMAPRVASPAMAQAMGIMARLAAANAAPWTPGGNATSRSTVPVTPEDWWAEGEQLPPNITQPDVNGTYPPCAAINPLFQKGRCLFTIDWGTAILRVTDDNAEQNVTDHLGVALLPGSYVVQAPNAQPPSPPPPPPYPAQPPGAPSAPSPPAAATMPALNMTPVHTGLPPGLIYCTPALCPHAIPYPKGAGDWQSILYGPAAAPPSPQAPPRSPGEQATEEGVPSAPPPSAPSVPPSPSAVVRLINRVPLIADTEDVWLVEKLSNVSLSAYIWGQEFSRAVSYQVYSKYSLLLSVPMDNLTMPGAANNGRRRLMQQQSYGGVSAGGPGGSNSNNNSNNLANDVLTLVEATIMLDLTVDNIETVLWAVRLSTTSSNILPDFALPFSAAYRNVLDWLAFQAATQPPEAYPSLMANASESFANITRAFPYQYIQRALYWNSIGLTNEPQPEPAQKDDYPDWLAGVIAASVTGAVLLVVLVVGGYVMWRMRRNMAGRRGGLSELRPPGPSPSTTLALTDVQNSTLLWEMLPAGVMDECLHTHHRVMREAIASSCGYEVFTEGDAFCVAFHGPDDALAFALEVQAGLLCAPWPEELLSHPDGCEVWARRVRPRPSSLHPTPHGTLLRQGAALGAGLGGSSRAPRSEDGDRSSALTLADMPLLPVVYSGQVPGPLGLHAPDRVSTVALHHKEAAMALARSGGMGTGAGTPTGTTTTPSRFNSLPAVPSTDGAGAGKAAAADLAAADSTTTQGNSVYLTPAQSGFSDHQLQQQKHHLGPPSRGASVTGPHPHPGPGPSPPQHAPAHAHMEQVPVASEGAGEERNSHESASAADWLLGLPGALPAAAVAAGESGALAAPGRAARAPAPEAARLGRLHSRGEDYPSDVPLPAGPWAPSPTPETRTSPNWSPARPGAAGATAGAMPIPVNKTVSPFDLQRKLAPISRDTPASPPIPAWNAAHPPEADPTPSPPLSLPPAPSPALSTRSGAAAAAATVADAVGNSVRSRPSSSITSAPFPSPNTIHSPAGPPLTAPSVPSSVAAQPADSPDPSPGQPGLPLPPPHRLSTGADVDMVPFARQGAEAPERSSSRTVMAVATRRRLNVQVLEEGIAVGALGPGAGATPKPGAGTSPPGAVALPGDKGADAGNRVSTAIADAGRLWRRARAAAAGFLAGEGEAEGQGEGEAEDVGATSEWRNVITWDAGPTPAPISASLNSSMARGGGGSARIPGGLESGEEPDGEGAEADGSSKGLEPGAVLVQSLSGVRSATRGRAGSVRVQGGGAGAGAGGAGGVGSRSASAYGTHKSVGRWLAHIVEDVVGGSDGGAVAARAGSARKPAHTSFGRTGTMARLMHAVKGSMRLPLSYGQPASPDRERPAAAATMRRATRGGSATLPEDVPFTRLNRITSMHPAAGQHDAAAGGVVRGGGGMAVGGAALELAPQLPVKLLACASIAHRYNETLMYSEAPASPTTQLPGPAPPRRLGTTARPAAGGGGAHKSSRWSFWGGVGGGSSADGTSPNAQQQQNHHQQQHQQQHPGRPTRLSLSVGGGSATTSAGSPTTAQHHRASSPTGLMAFFSASGRAQQAGSATSSGGGGSGRLRMSLPRLVSRFNRSSRPRPASGDGNGDAASGSPGDGTAHQQLMLTPLVGTKSNGHANHAPPAPSHHPEHTDKPGTTAQPPTPPPLPLPPVTYPAPAPALPPHLLPAHSAAFPTYSSSSLHVAFAPSGHASASLPIGFGASSRLAAGGGSPGASRLGLASFAVASSVKGALSRLGGHMPSGNHAIAGGGSEEGACFDEFYRDINTLTARMVVAGAAAAAAAAAAYPNSNPNSSFNPSVHAGDRSVHGHSVAGSRTVDTPGWNHAHAEQQQHQQQHPLLLLQKQRSGPGVPGPRSGSDGGGGGDGGSSPSVSWTLSSILRMLFVQMDPEEAHIYMEQQEQQQRNTTAGGQAGAGAGGGGPRAGSDGAVWGGGVVSGMLGRMATSLQSSGGGGGAGAGAGGGGGGGSVGRSEDGEVELALRGLRVRVGLHSGARDSEVHIHLQDGIAAASYTGDFLAVAKEVSDAALGGVVVLSGAAFRAYQQQLRLSARDLEVMLLHLGEHVIKPPSLPEAASRAPDHGAVPPAPSSPGRELYGAVFAPLMSRLALLPAPVRTHREVVPGCLAAPAGLVAPVFCNVMGLETLLAWEAVVNDRYLRAQAAAAAAAAAAGVGSVKLLGGGVESSAGVPPAAAANGTRVGSGGAVVGKRGSSMDVGGVNVVRAALELFCDMAQEAAARHGGYVVAASADGGHWVLVFGCAAAAVEWGLDMLGAMLRAAWPEGLLEHELAEEVWEGSMLVKRGLRLCIGIDYGQANVRLVPRTGRLDYVGKAMNRAARIAAKAKAATVYASGAAWAAARPSLEQHVAATALGTMALKGVRERMELWALRHVRQLQPGQQQEQQQE